MNKNLTIETATVLMDFNKSYSFTIQEKAQSYHQISNASFSYPVMIHLQDEQREKRTA